MNNKGVLFSSIQVLATGILMCVLTAQLKVPWGTSISLVSRISAGLMICVVALLALNSVAELVIGKKFKKVETVLPYCSLVVGALVFFFNEAYFKEALSIDWQNYWVLVSYYSLPAIMVEGGILALFDQVVYKDQTSAAISVREKKYVVVLLALYLICAITANFLALGHLVSVGDQVFFSRTIIVIILGIKMLMHLKK